MLEETGPVEFSVVCNCIIYNLPLKRGIHNCIQTFLKLLKTFADSWYEMCPHKMRLPCRLLDRWNVAYKEIMKDPENTILFYVLQHSGTVTRYADKYSIHGVELFCACGQGDNLLCI